MPKKDCILAQFNTEYAGRRVGVGYAVVGIGTISRTPSGSNALASSMMAWAKPYQVV